jgi:hypothetical protein
MTRRIQALIAGVLLTHGLVVLADVGDSASSASSTAVPSQAASIKHISLASDGSVYLSLGGELRERFEYYSEPFFGLRGVEADRYLLHRLLLNADLHAGNYLRFFVEFGDHLEVGKEAPLSPTDIDEFDVQQAFADLTLLFDASGKVMLRIGRQEINLGSGRLVSVREGSNVRRSFDGARVTLTAGAATFDAFAVRTVNLKVGALNDDPNRNEGFWGLYGVIPVSVFPDGHADLYYLGLQRDGAVFQQGTADELRHSFGTRLWGKPGAWDYNYEALVQTGSFGSAQILAWTVATDTGCTAASAPFKPRVGLKADIASGDGNPSDDRLTTFNALFPKQPYFSEASVIAPANIIDIHPSIALQLPHSVTFTTDVDFFWKQRVEDAVYAPPGRPLVPAGQSEARYVGTQVNAELEWQINRNTSVALYYSHLFAGSAVTAAGGRDIDFVGSWVKCRF